MPYKDPQKQKEAQHRSYERNKQANIARTSNNRVERRRALAKYAQAAKQYPCVDCKVQYPYYVMEFDHVRGKKLGAVCNLINEAVKMEVLQAEIAKCEVVCSNCHSIRTFERGNYNGVYGQLV